MTQVVNFSITKHSTKMPAQTSKNKRPILGTSIAIKRYITPWGSNVK